MDTEIYREIVTKWRTPTFVYSEEILRENTRRIKRAVEDNGLEGRVKIYAAYFANSHPRLFSILAEEGIGVTIQGIEEYHQLKSFGLEGMNIKVSPGVLPEEELEFFINERLQVNVALLEELEYVLQKSDKVGVRIDLSYFQDQRTGLKKEEFRKATHISKRLGKEIYAIHTYPGTDSDLNKLVSHVNKTLRVYNEYFQSAKEINLGGGFSFNYCRGQHFPWKEYFKQLQSLLNTYKIREDIEISIEPGRDIFADAGELLVKVNKVRPYMDAKAQRIIYTDGSYVLMPSASKRLRCHRVLFFQNDFCQNNDLSVTAFISGCTTLSSDYLFPWQVQAPAIVSNGSHIIIKDIGAYGASQHMEFLNKRPAAEVLVRKNGTVEVISRRGDYTDRVRYAVR